MLVNIIMSAQTSALQCADTGVILFKPFQSDKYDQAGNQSIILLLNVGTIPSYLVGLSSLGTAAPFGMFPLKRSR